MTLKNLSISDPIIVEEDFEWPINIKGTLTFTSSELKNNIEQISVHLISEREHDIVASIGIFTLGEEQLSTTFNFEADFYFDDISFIDPPILGDILHLEIRGYQDWAPLDDIYYLKSDIIRIISSKKITLSQESPFKREYDYYSFEEIYAKVPYYISLELQDEYSLDGQFLLFPNSFFKIILYRNNEENIFFEINFNQNESIVCPELIFPENETFIIKFLGQITLNDSNQIIIDDSFSFQTKKNPEILFNFSLFRQDYNKNKELFFAGYGENIVCSLELNIPEINFLNKFPNISIEIYEGDLIYDKKVFSISQKFISPKLYSFNQLLEGSYSKDNSYDFHIIINNGFYEEIKKITVAAFLEPTLRIEKNNIGLWKNLSDNGFTVIPEWKEGRHYWKDFELSYKGNYYKKITDSRTNLTPLEDNLNFKLISSEEIYSTFYSNAKQNYFSNYLQFNQTNYWSEREASWNILINEIEINSDSQQEPFLVRMNLDGEVIIEGTIKIGGSSSQRVIGYLPKICCPIYSKSFIISVGPYNTNYALNAKIIIEPSGEIILVRIFNGTSNYTNATKVDLYFNIKYTTGSLFYIPALNFAYDEAVGQKIFGIFNRRYTSNNSNFFYASSEQSSYELFNAFSNSVFNLYDGWKNMPEDTKPYIIINNFSQSNSNFGFSTLRLIIKRESIEKISSINIYSVASSGVGFGSFLKTFTNLESFVSDNTSEDLVIEYKEAAFSSNEKIKIEFNKQKPSDVIHVESITIENPYRYFYLHNNPFSPNNSGFWELQESMPW